MNTLLVFVSVVSLALCQTSTNPVGTPFFSESVVKQLPLNSTISSVLLNTTYYTEYFWVYIPSYVATVQYTLNNTNQCGSSIRIYFEAVDVLLDPSTSFSCWGTGTGSDLCDQYGDTMLAYEQNYAEKYFYPSYDSIRPGQHHYLSVTRTSNEELVNCPYSITVQVLDACPGSDIYFNEGTSCLNVTSVTNGETVIKTPGSNSVDYYRMVPPQNVSRIWAILSSTVPYLNLMLSGGFATSSTYYSDAYTSNYLSFNEESGLYFFLVQRTQIAGNYPWYFSVYFPNTKSVSSYNITFSWSDCGASFSGIGQTNYTSIAYGQGLGFTIPDCSDPVVYNNIPPLAGSYPFNLPAYNASIDYGVAAAYAYIYVPFGTTGAFTCNSTAPAYYAFITFAKGVVTGSDFESSDQITINCVTSTLTLLSQDLYVGGYWSIGVFSGSSQPETVTLRVQGSATAPASPTPSPGSSTTSAGSDSGASVMMPNVLWLCAIIWVLMI